MFAQWRTRIAMLVWLVLFLVTMLTTRVPYVAPLSFIVVVMIAWDYGFRAALAWIGLIHVFVPFVLFAFGLGPFVVFSEARELVAAIMAVSVLTVVGLAYLIDRLHVLTRQLRESKQAIEATNGQLQAALAEVKELRGLLPICAWCKRIRSQDGEWEVLETYLLTHTRAELTHGMCPKCLEEQLRDMK